MDAASLFSSKAEKYHKFRWRYAPQAVQVIFELTGIGRASSVADIGAGTGILARELAPKVGLVYAVEPNPEMRAVAMRELAKFPSIRVIAGRAEATTLASHSVDLIAAAQAVQWFEPQAARQEFLRILKPGGWLALLRNFGTDRKLSAALDKIYPPELDTGALMPGKDVPRSFYYEEEPLRLEYPIRSRLTWEGFIGALSTASYAPDESSPAYPEFERRARRIFERFSLGGHIDQHGLTELYLGRMRQD